MRDSKVAAFPCGTGIVLFALIFLSINALASVRGRVLYAFQGDPDCGNLADAPLIADAAGNLYGTTSNGGADQDGCVFRLARTGSGWSETVLYSFSGSDGRGPREALAFDKLGNLYGTTVEGGTYNEGVVFELSPSASGWTETVLYSFGNGEDGYTPESNLVFDSVGNLYGTTSSGGSRRGGTVFRLSPRLSGWTETVLYNFPNSIAGPDGDSPIGGVVMDRAGNLYGVTAAGGAAGGYGAVYELALSGSGSYTEKVIYSFNGPADGWEPSAGLATDGRGQLYGTTSSGGDTSVCYFVGCGIVFQLHKDAAGNWVERILHAMTGSDGDSPIGPVVFDSAGNAYIVGQFGGLNGMGSVLELTPTASGPWTETVLHLFDFIFPNGVDGEAPYAGLTVIDGHIFGTTSSGGVYDNGIVFEITPP